MISFTDRRLYVKGTCQAILSDPVTGDIAYYSNKFTTGNISTSVTMGEIRAGLGNPVATIIPSDSGVNVEFNAADFSMFAKAAQVGAALNYNAPEMVCQTITATATSLTVDVSKGTPTGQLGYNKVFCYVQEVGAAAPIAQYGQSYLLAADTGAITGFEAVAGKTYKVWYFVNKASAQVATLKSLFNPRVMHFTAQLPVYANDASSEQNEGSRVGWLYVIVPRLKLGGNANITGEQTSNDTTSVSGQAVAFDETVVSENCADCSMIDLAYYVFVPDNEAEQITGLAVIGGVVTLPVSSAKQIPVKYVMANGELVNPNYADLSFTASDAPSGTTVSETGMITSGATAGEFDVTVKYPKTGTAEFTTLVNVSVESVTS